MAESEASKRLGYWFGWKISIDAQEVSVSGKKKSSTQTNTQYLASDSAIGLHLLQNPVYAQHYDDCRIFILTQGHSTFYLSAIEATFIKTSNNALCRQNDFVYIFKIVH